MVGLFQSGQLFEVFLPKYIEIKSKEGKEAAYIAFSVLFNWIISFGTVLCFFLWIFAPLIIPMLVPGFEESELKTTVLMFRIIIPVLILQLASNYLFMLGNAERLFGQAESASLIASMAGICIIFFMHSYFSVWVMVISLWANHILSFLFRMILLSRRGFKYRFIFKTDYVNHWQIMLKTLSTLPYILSTQLFNFVFINQLSQLPQGIFAVVRYAQTIFLKLRGILIRPTAVVFFTNIAEDIASSSKHVKARIKSGLHQMSTVVFLITIPLFFSIDQFLAFIWYGDSFSLDKIENTALVLRYLMISAIVSGIGVVYQKVNVSMGRITTHYLAIAIAQCLSLMLALIFINNFSIQGVILTLVCQQVVLACAAYLVSVLFYPQYVIFFAFSCIIRWILIIAVSFISGPFLLKIICNLFAGADLKVFEHLIIFILHTSVQALIVLLLAHMLGIKEVKETVSFILNRFNKHVPTH